MSVSGKTIYRVRQVVGHEFAIISEVKDGETNGGKVKETRDTRIVLGGAGSFWLVGGEKKEQKLLLQKEDTALPAFAAAISQMTTRIFDLPNIVNDNAVPGKFDAVSFSTVAKLAVGYSPPDGAFDQVLASLLEGTLRIPAEATVSAIEVAPGRWLTSGLDALPSGRYSMRRQSLRSVATSAMENRPDTIKLPLGLVVFASAPKWTDPQDTDLRPEDEVLRSVDQWLARSKAAVALSGMAGQVTPSELLRMLSASAVSEDEKADLAAVAGILAQRSDLLDILPEILGRHPAYQEVVAKFEKAEMTRLRTEIEQKIRKEMEADAARLHELRREIAEAEARIEGFSHREALLRAETEKHDDLLRRRIENAAAALKDETARETLCIREDVGRLREEVAQIASAATAIPEARPDEPVRDEVVASAPAVAGEDQRQKTLRELAVATGLSVSELAAVVAASTETVPVLVGPEAAVAAVDIATALAGEQAAVVFCDPTKVSLSDLLLDENSGLQAAIEAARARPEVLAAAAICGITSGPCEYWIPQIVEMRRAGRLPRNLAVIASAGIDGTRVSVPASVLRHLFPLTAAGTARPGSAKFEGAWPAPASPDPERFREAVDILVDGGLEGAILQAVARMLARTPGWIKASDTGEVFLRQGKWLSAAAAGDANEHDKYFKNIEG